MKYCKCLKCKRVHIAWTRSHALEELRRYTDRGDWFDPVMALEGYERCVACGWLRFEAAEPEDCPAGCTISPVIFEG